MDLIFLLFTDACFLFFMTSHQVALLDFGATRGFNKHFTDTYIEVRSVLVVVVVHCVAPTGYYAT